MTYELAHDSTENNFLVFHQERKENLQGNGKCTSCST